MASAYGQPDMRSPTRRGGNQTVYQIDFTAVASGKRIANTKRRVRWRFGFTNLEALENGETGTACRGEEHDITLVWSVTSGKRLVLADGQEVHYSNSRSGNFEFSWTMRGNHVLKIVAHASAPISATSSFRQYDFFIDGQSFFTFPKVYRLGLSGKDARNVNVESEPIAIADRSRTYRNYDLDSVDAGASTIVAIEAPHNEDEEQAYLQEAIKNSLQDNQKPPSQPVPSPGLPIAEQPPPAQTENLLLDFFSESPAPVAAPAPSAMVPAQTQSSPYAITAQQPAAYNQHPFAAAPTPNTSYQSAVSDPFATQPSSSITSQVSAPAPPAAIDPFSASTSSYAAPAPTVSISDPFSFQAPAAPQPATQPAPPQPAPQPVTSQPAVADPFSAQQPPAASLTTSVQSSFLSSQATAPTPQPVETPTISNTASAPVTFDSFLSNLSGQPTEQKLSGSTSADQAVNNLMNGFSIDLNANAKTNVEKHNPFDAPQPTLAGLQNAKPQTTKKEIMATPGAMVVSSNQSGNWGGYGMGYGQGMATQQGYNYPPQQHQQQPYGYPSNYNAYPYQQGQQQQQQQPNYNYQQQQQQPPNNFGF